MGGRDLKNGSDLSAHAWQSAGMVRVRISIVFESGARIGPGKAKLLESIRDTGSISAAARDMGMSYKRAWALLDSINQAFTEPVVTAAPIGQRSTRSLGQPLANGRPRTRPGALGIRSSSISELAIKFAVDLGTSICDANRTISGTLSPKLEPNTQF
jgi:hypothetical protein